jgi:hypothetical protein
MQGQTKTTRFARVLGTKKWAYQGWRETGVYLVGTGRGKSASSAARTASSGEQS